MLDLFHDEENSTANETNSKLNPQFQFTIDGIDNNFSRDYLCQICLEKHSIANLKFPEATYRNIVIEYLRFHRKYPRDATIVNTIVNDSISCKGFKPLLSSDKWLGDEIINYVFKLFNIRAHLYAALKNQKTDFFVTSLFVSKLFGEDVRKYNFNEVKVWVKKRHPFRDLFEGYRKV